MDRALREYRIRGVATNLAFLEAVLAHPKFRANDYTTRFIDETPELFHLPARRDRATKLLTYIADVTVNGHPETRGARQAAAPMRARPKRRIFGRAPTPMARKQLLDELGPEKFADWMKAQKPGAGHRHHHARRAPVAARHAHAHLRHRGRRRGLCQRPAAASLAGMLGRRDLRCGDALSQRRPVGAAGRDPRARAQHSYCRCCCAAPMASATPIIPTMWCRHFVRQAAEAGMDLFRIFDCLNWVENMRVAIDAVLRSGQAGGRRDLLHRRSARSRPRQI